MKTICEKLACRLRLASTNLYKLSEGLWHSKFLIVNWVEYELSGSRAGASDWEGERSGLHICSLEPRFTATSQQREKLHDGWTVTLRSFSRQRARQKRVISHLKALSFDSIEVRDQTYGGIELSAFPSPLDDILQLHSTSVFGQLCGYHRWLHLFWVVLK